MDTEITKTIVNLLNYDVWGHITNRFNMSQKDKLKLFAITSIFLSILLEIIIQEGDINSFTLITLTFLWISGMLINPDSLYNITKVSTWEIIIGAVVIFCAFTIVTPLKHIYFPETRDFGVLNGGVVILGVFLIFYGVKKYKVVYPYCFIFLAFISLNFVWKILGDSFVGSHMAIISSNLAYQMLKFFGYSVTLNGTTISIITANGKIVSATIAGLCSGVEGITFSIVVLILLFMGSNVPYKIRILAIFVASLVMFFLNILRISLIFVAAYYYGHTGLEEAHLWLGNILFFMFITLYWYIIYLKYNKPYRLDEHENN